MGGIFCDDIDYISKYDFYGLLAQTAIDYLRNNSNVKSKDLLIAVLNTFDEDKDLNLPQNIKLPFFAYGIFKPDQLAFNIIKDLVKFCENVEVYGILKDRDGIPIFANNPTNQNNLVLGFLIHFKDGQESDAYKRIAKFEPDNYYYWKNVITTKDVECNILFGRSPDKGTSPFDYGNWDGRNDPYFKEALDEIESILENNKRSDIAPDSPIPFFHLQMGYMLLWTSIERYASMKYYLGNNVYEKIKLMGNEEIFAKSLNNNVKRKHKIVSAKDLKVKILDPTNPQKSLNYYYGIRSNSAHRGKEVAYEDYDIIEHALIELLAIFKDLLEESWNIDKKRC